MSKMKFCDLRVFPIYLLWLVFNGNVMADMTLISRQNFDTSGVLASGNQTGFQQVQGAFHQRQGGPSVAENISASADLRFENNASVFGRFIPENLESDKYFVGAWFFVKSLNTFQANWLAVCDVNGNVGPCISEFSGKLGAGVIAQSWTPLPISESNQWIYLAIAVKHNGGGSGHVRYYYKFPGQPLNQWAASNNTQLGISSLRQFFVGCQGNNPSSKLRIGCPSLYTFESDSFLDVNYPEDLVEPVSKLTWYCNPETGNDANDGRTPQSAWRSIEKINRESLYTGFLSANSHEEGDTLIIDTSTRMIEMSGTELALRSEGLNVRAAEGQEWIRVKSYKTISTSTWNTTVMANVYSTTDTQADIVIWENDRFMNHPKGAQLATVKNALISVPGSFWTDGTTLYLHPFDSTDPRSDGKRYERSFNWGTAAPVMLAARNMSVRDLHIGKTCLARSADNDAIGSYCLGNWTALGRCVISHCFLYYGSKHIIGITEGGVGDQVTIDDVQAEQGSPYVGPGGQTPFVSFNHQFADLPICP